jgi:hypothetical protein
MHKKLRPDKNGRAGSQNPGLRKTRMSSVQDLLARKPGLRAFAAAQPLQSDWQDWLIARLPAELAPHLAQVLKKPAELIVYAENAAWSSRLRYAVAELLPQIQARDAQLQRIAVRIRPRTPAP